MTIPPNSPLRLVWGILWRAQASHLLVVVIGPLVWSLVVAAATIVFLPFNLLGAGSKNVSLPGHVRHLAEPMCWVAAAPCTVASRVLWSSPSGSSVRPSTSATSKPAQARSPESELSVEFTVRLLWLFVLVLWVVHFLWSRERRAAA